MVLARLIAVERSEIGAAEGLRLSRPRGRLALREAGAGDRRRRRRCSAGCWAPGWGDYNTAHLRGVLPLSVPAVPPGPASLRARRGASAWPRPWSARLARCARGAALPPAEAMRPPSPPPLPARGLGDAPVRMARPADAHHPAPDRALAGPLVPDQRRHRDWRRPLVVVSCNGSTRSSTWSTSISTRRSART